MTKGIKIKTGPFLHADDACLVKEFEDGLGGMRTFIVIIAGAYYSKSTNKVIPDRNGIAVIDEDNKLVLLDGHANELSGLMGPSDRQIQQFKKIMAMNWREFSVFLRDHPNFRGGMDDVNKKIPDYRYYENEILA